MKIDRTHDREAFTASEMKSLIEENRVFFFDPFGRTDEFRYVVLHEITRPQIYATDAWLVNEIGQKEPGQIFPAPVRMDEISAIGFASPDVRLPIMDFAAGKKWTFVFGLPRRFAMAFDHSEAARYLGKSVGVGANITQARLDAIVRLKQRFPAISTLYDELSPAEMVEASSHDRYCQLLTCLESGDVSCLSKEPGSVRQEMGHGYMNDETYDCAVSLGSTTPVHEALEKTVDENERFAVLTAQARAIVGRINPAVVDWADVASEFEQDAAEQEAQQVKQAKRSPAPKAPKAPKGEANEPAEPVDGRRIKPEVLAVLSQCRAQENRIYLPAERLDPKLYKSVNEVLAALGGKWVAKNIQAHVFEEDAGPILEMAVQTGTYVKPQDFGFFPTPANLVERVLGMARIEPGMRLLEPNGGTGAFALPMAAMAGGLDRVTVCELLPSNVKKLRELGFTNIHHGDFLEMTPAPVFDFIAMNPPFSGGADIAHVMHATKFLRPQGQLLAITSPTWTTIQNKKSAAFRDFVADVGADMETVERGAFSESGTQIETRILKFEAANFPWHRNSIGQASTPQPVAAQKVEVAAPAQAIQALQAAMPPVPPLPAAPPMAKEVKLSRSERFAHKRLPASLPSAPLAPMAPSARAEDSQPIHRALRPRG